MRAAFRNFRRSILLTSYIRGSMSAKNRTDTKDVHCRSVMLLSLIKMMNSRYISATNSVLQICRNFLRIRKFRRMNSRKRFIRYQAEIHRIGIAIVPTTTNTRIASHLMIIHHFDLATNKLLLFTLVRHRVLA